MKSVKDSKSGESYKTHRPSPGRRSCEQFLGVRGLFKNTTQELAGYPMDIALMSHSLRQGGIFSDVESPILL